LDLLVSEVSLVSFFDFGVNSDNLGAHRLAGSKFFWWVLLRCSRMRYCGGHRGSVCWLEALHPSLGAGADDFHIPRHSVVATVFV
jgi:hypothetical protein